jgi:hypothetical protein
MYLCVVNYFAGQSREVDEKKNERGGEPRVIPRVVDADSRGFFQDFLWLVKKSVPAGTHNVRPALTNARKLHSQQLVGSELRKVW